MQSVAVPVPRSVYAAKLRDFPDLVFSGETAFQFRGRWSQFFRTRIGPAFDGRVIFEIGCFDAALVARLAAKFPRTGFVGLDWKCKAICDGATRLTTLGLKNAALIRGRGQDISRIFGERELDEILLFHPDPCDRDVELKNRLFSERFLLDAHRALRDATSTLSLKTDHAGYYQWALCTLGLCEQTCSTNTPERSDALRQRFDVPFTSRDFWNDPAALAHTCNRCFAREVTLFESRFLKRRQPIYYLEMRKR